MSNTRKARKVKRQTLYLLRFWDGIPQWAAGAKPCDCGKPHDIRDDATEVGATIVAAKNFDQAIRVAWHLGCNPGGEVMGSELTLGAAELESVGVPVGELIADTEWLHARLSHARMHLS